MSCINCQAGICSNSCSPVQAKDISTLLVAESSINAALLASNGKESSIRSAIRADIELITAHLPKMDPESKQRAERTLQKLKLNNRRYDEQIKGVLR